TLRTYLEPVAAIEQDKLGSLVARKEGSSARPRVILAAHMDEIGLMVRYITKEGFLKFVQLGGWWDQTLLGQRMIVKTHKGDLVGIIGAKPPHLLKKEDRDKIVRLSDMYIDIGVSSKEEVEEAGVRLGDPVVPDSAFHTMANGQAYLNKAWDDRAGCALMVQVLQQLAREPHPNTVYAAATVQEEVGLRGAQTSAALVDPDVAIILDVDIAGDIPGLEDEEKAVAMGKGPSVLLYDAAMIPNLKLRDLVIETAKQEEIPLQMSAITGGATDGGRIHMHDQGVPTITIGLPSRHIHSHNSVIHRGDYDNALKLLMAVIRKLDADTVASLAL
ncbi:MAG: M42 family metallopeptidase, partial [Chloroflexi bacterium]|nr:M42 family metallopeptidase [Chloroflexota bacterium]